MNALMKLTGGANYQPTELESLILEETVEDENAYDLQATRLHIAPGGTGSFVSADGAMSDLRKLEGIVAVSQKARAYWPGKSLGKPPLCASVNGLKGVFNFSADDKQMQDAMKTSTIHPAVRLFDENGSAPESYDCAACPLSQWGSGRAGKGQGCKSLRRLIVLLDGMAMPVILSLPPTSVGAWDAYCSSLSQKRSQYFAVRTIFSLEKATTPDGEPYSVVKLELNGMLGIEDVKAVIEVRRKFEDWVRSKAINVEDYEAVLPPQPVEVVPDGDDSGVQDIPF